MLAVRRQHGFAVRLLEAGEPHHLYIQAIRKGRRKTVGDIVVRAGTKVTNHLIDERRIRQRAIPGQTHNDIGLIRPCRLHHAPQHVVEASAATRNIPLATRRGEDIVDRIRAGSDDDNIHFRRTPEPLDVAKQHRLSEDRQKHLPGQP